MTLIDKLLLGSLIVLLPLGLLLSRTLLSKGDSANGETASATKIEALLEKIAQQKITPQTEATPFNITGVIYASESATFKVAGIAPSYKYSIRASQVIIPQNTGLPTELDAKKLKDDEVLGQEIVWKAVKPQADGGFTYETKITETSGIVEVQLDQAGVVEVVRYDLAQRKQLD